ncbi:MAG: hypothetical protein V7637_1015 [Mycobacteriales bacterium]
MSGDSEPDPWTAQPPLVEGLVDPRPLGQGGFGTVFRVWQAGVGREVALKVGGRVLSDERGRRRFLREANAAGRLSSHTHIVAVYDAGVAEDGRPYLIMELCSRGSLVDRLRAGGPLPPEEVRGLGVGIADALATAHAAGVLHRDVKPGNILVDEYGVAKLADFGLAAVLDASGDSSATREGLTPAYSPPEAFAFARPTTRLDVYGLAATLYALLAGRPPRVASWPPISLAELTAGLHAPVPPVPGVHPDLLAVLARALDPEPDNRTASAAVLRDDLRALPAAAAPGPLGLSGPGRSSSAAAVQTGASVTLPSLSGPVPAPGPDTTPPPSAVAADHAAADVAGADRAATGGPTVDEAALDEPDVDRPGVGEAGGDEAGPAKLSTGPVPAPADQGAVAGPSAAGDGPGRRAGRGRRRRLVVVVAPVPVVVAIIAVPLLLHDGGGVPGPAAIGPTVRSVTNTAAQTPTPTPPGSGRSTNVSTDGPGGAPGTRPSGPHASGAPAATPTDRPPASRPAVPPTTPPADRPGGTGLPSSLVVCAGSAGDALCPTTPTCWDVVVPVGDSRSAPPPEGCSQAHRVEAYAAGRLPAEGNANPAIAHTCTPSRMRARASGDIKGWKRDVQQLLIPSYGWFFYCVARPKDGSPVTAQAFITGP